MRYENERMKKFLNDNGIEAQPKFIWDGSLKGTWRIYNRNMKWYDNMPLWEKMTELGFKDYSGKPLDQYAGNGGLFAVFVRFDKTKEFITP